MAQGSKLEIQAHGRTSGVRLTGVALLASASSLLVVLSTFRCLLPCQVDNNSSNNNNSSKNNNSNNNSKQHQQTAAAAAAAVAVAVLRLVKGTILGTGGGAIERTWWGFISSRLQVSRRDFVLGAALGVNFTPPALWRKLLRGGMVNRTYGTHKNLYISFFLPTVFGPINYGPPC